MQLVKRLKADVVGDALGEVEHVDRDQPLLELGTGSAQRGNVEGVDRVDRVADEQAFAPANHLLAHTNVTRVPGQLITLRDEGIEDL
ncbi:hypothetical protein D3C81_1869860 [compost metagenome]